MRVASLVLVAALGSLAGCPRGDSTCELDSDCGGDVCARTGECLPAAQVRLVRVTWTIRGMPASATTCATSPDLYIQFDGTAINDTFGYTPVPCAAGLFTIDKIPTRFISVELGREGQLDAARQIDATGMASFDLYP